ncbi:MAG: hypothetical protein GTO41_27855, partial [Burkholderiales bacterium]|nr:hypothetical protein [Burkholderiales bacterium]
KEPDFNRLEEEQFTNTIIARIPILGATMGMQSLIVVAPARMLGGFRNQLPKDLQNNLLAEIPKLLTHLTVDEMTSQLVAEW